MMHHLTEEPLIEYHFGLASESRARSFARHLQHCPECRKKLEQLKLKFSALDLLEEEIELPEELVLKVTGYAARPVKRIMPFAKLPVVIGAAAAVLLMCSLFLVSTVIEQPSRSGSVKLRPGKAAAGKRVSLDKSREPLAGYAASQLQQVPVVATLEEKSSRPAAKAAAPIPEQPPFAPASAIELVTLPRTESVQLTIYNSTFTGFAPEPAASQVSQVQSSYDGDVVSTGISIKPPRQQRIPRRLPRGGGPRKPPAGLDLTLVRERRNLTLKRGWNWLQFAWSNTRIDPTSLHIEPLEHKDKIAIKELVFPSRLRELGRWLIRSEVSGQVPFEITYFTSGLTWRAFYMGTLSRDEKTMQLSGYVRIDNRSGQDYENARTRLIVGRVHLIDRIAVLARRRYPYGRGGRIQPPISSVQGLTTADSFGGGATYEYGLKEIIKEGLSEYFLYTIEGTETIPDKWGRRLLSFDVNGVNVKSLYKYDEQRYGRQTVRFVSFTNDDEHNLGKTPIPNGQIRIYKTVDESGHLAYVGGTDIKYIPVGEKVELNLGPARLVNVEPKLMKFETKNYVFDDDGNIVGWDEIRWWRIKVTNSRMSPVEVEITRDFNTSYWTIESDITYEKYDYKSVRFTLELKPRSNRIFGYTVTAYHGARERQLEKRNSKGRNLRR